MGPAGPGWGWGSHPSTGTWAESELWARAARQLLHDEPDWTPQQPSMLVACQTAGLGGPRCPQRSASPQNLLLALLHSIKEALKLPGPLAVHEALSNAGVQAPGELQGSKSQGGARGHTAALCTAQGSGRCQGCALPPQGPAGSECVEETCEFCSKRGSSRSWPGGSVGWCCPIHQGGVQSPGREQARVYQRTHLSPKPASTKSPG